MALNRKDPSLLRVGYLSACETGEDSPAFQAFAAAVLEAGFRLTPVTLATVDEASPFDVILCADPTCFKVTSHPTFLVADQPRSAYIGHPDRLDAVRSFDGYLCVSSALEQLFSHLSAPSPKALGPGRIGAGLVASAAVNPGPQSVRLAIGPADPHDRDARRLRRHLTTHAGVVAFEETDREAAQAAYSWCGAGLVLPSLEHAVDNLMPTALLDIVATGALALCPYSDAVAEAFGDSVHYYDAFAEPAAILLRIEAMLAKNGADPAAAAARAKRAHGIFLTRFSAPVVLAEASAYLARWSEAQQRRAAPFADSLIDVIMRAGGRPTAFVRRALDSIDRQSAGRYRVIIVCYKPIDLSELITAPWRRINAIEIVEVFGGNRSQTMIAGLERTASAYFAMLDDDDYLLSDHFLGLLESAARAQSGHVFSYSNVLKLDETVRTPSAGGPRWEILEKGAPQGDFDKLIGRFTSHCFLAARHTLDLIEFRHWRSTTAEDGLLIFALLRLAQPVHSWAASCVYCQGRADGSAFRDDPNRFEDELALMLEFGQTYRDVEDRFHRSADRGPQMIAEAHQRLLERGRQDLQAKLPVHAGINRAVAQAQGSGGLLDGRIIVEIPLTRDRLSTSRPLRSAGPGAPLLIEMGASWERSLMIDIADHVLPECEVAAEMTLAGADNGASLALIDKNWRIAGQTTLATDTVQAGVIALGGPDLRAVALCAGPRPRPGPVQVSSLRLGYDLDDLALYFAISPDQQAVRQRLLNHLAGRPHDVGPRLGAIDLLTPSSRFAHRLDGGSSAEDESITVGSGGVPWDYFAQIAVTETAAAGGKRLRLMFRMVGEPFFVFLTDAGHNGVIGERVMVRQVAGPAEVWLDLAGAAQGCFIVLQCLDNPGDASVALDRIEVYG